MLLQGIRWSEILLCTGIYSITFLLTRDSVLMQQYSGLHGQPALLMFMLPGSIAAWRSPQMPLLTAITGALLAAPVCWSILYFCLPDDNGFWQELAWLISAVFWCGFGAMMMLLLRRRKQKASAKKK